MSKNAEKDKAQKGKAPGKKKPYIKPRVERMNEKVPATTAGPPVPGAPASAQASPIAPGATVF